MTQDTSVTPRDELPYAIESNKNKKAREIFWTRIAAYRGIFQEQGDDASAELRMREIFTACGWKSNTDEYSPEIENIDISFKLNGGH